jgi:DNA-directed RNA polymerase specialized sigma subunit
MTTKNEMLSVLRKTISYKYDAIKTVRRQRNSTHAEKEMMEKNLNDEKNHLMEIEKLVMELVPEDGAANV